jgi:hypothetical protein
MTWMMRPRPPRSTAALIETMAPLAKARHASARLRSALVLLRSANAALDADTGMPQIRRRMIAVIDELDALENFLSSIALDRPN